MKAGIYIRISTKDQKTDLQLDELQEYCQRRNWQIADVYSDKGISGSKNSRPELDRLMADAHKRKFDVVCVWKFDRFARSVSHLLRALEEFKALGIEFVSYSESIDTSTPMGKMVFTVLGAVAELERSLITERVRAGQAAAKKRGVRFGRPAVAVDSKKVIALRNQGKSFSEIAEKLRIAKGTAFKLASGMQQPG